MHAVPATYSPVSSLHHALLGDRNQVTYLSTPRTQNQAQMESVDWTESVIMNARELIFGHLFLNLLADKCNDQYPSQE